MITRRLRELLDQVNSNDPAGRTNRDLVANTIIEMAIGGNQQVIKVLLDRVEGAVVQKVEVERKFSAMTKDQLMQELGKRLGLAEEPLSDIPQVPGR